MDLSAVQTLVGKFSYYVINPILLLLFSVGLLVFIWGIIEFLLAMSGLPSGTKVDDGKKHMFWGLVGMFIMVAAYTLVYLIEGTATGLLGGGSFIH